MTDLAVRYNPTVGRMDLVPAALAATGGNGFADAGDLETAVLASLFTWGRAGPDDSLPDGEDRKGHWAEAWPRAPGRRIGSLLWLLARRVLTNEVAEEARQYASAALAWLVEDGIAERVDVIAARETPTRLSLAVTVVQPFDRVLRIRFEDVWADIGRV